MSDPERQQNITGEDVNNVFGRIAVGVLAVVAAVSLVTSGVETTGEIVGGDMPDAAELTAVGGSAVALVTLGALYYALHERGERAS